MNREELISLLDQCTKLKPNQLKILSKLIIKYEETNEIAYQAIGMLNSGIKYARIKEDLMNKRFGWESQPFQEYRQKRDFRDKLLTKPPEILEGEMECPFCHSKKTMVVEMQTRSADEGFTYYIHCFNPKCMKVKKT